MLGIMGVVAAMLSPLTGNSGEPASPPVYLLAEPVGEGVRLSVVGSSPSELRVSFILEVNSDTVSGGNKSLHQGGGTLGGGVPITLSTVTLGNVTPGRWSARLRVEPRGGQPYEQTKTSLDPSQG